jgi:predicted chitinase
MYYDPTGHTAVYNDIGSDERYVKYSIFDTLYWGYYSRKNGGLCAKVRDLSMALAQALGEDTLNTIQFNKVDNKLKYGNEYRKANVSIGSRSFEFDTQGTSNVVVNAQEFMEYFSPCISFSNQPNSNGYYFAYWDESPYREKKYIDAQKKGINRVYLNIFDNINLDNKFVYISREQLIQLGWDNNKVTTKMLDDLNITIEKYIINGAVSKEQKLLRIRYFMAQCMEETGNGTTLTEAGYLTIEEQKKYCKQYDYVKELGNNAEGMGFKYRGAGYIQTTGYSNYYAFKEEVGDERIINEGAEYLASNYAWQSSGFWWKNNDINTAIDEGASLLEISRMCNGGPRRRFDENFIPGHMEERKACYNRCVQVIK